jgi:hypothetical protein
MRNPIVRIGLILAATFLALIIGSLLLLPPATVDAAKPPTRTPRATNTPGPTSTPTLTPTPSAGLTCSTSTTLESLVTCIASHFGPFVIPSSQNQTDWRTVVTNMLNAQCDFAPPGSLAVVYQVRAFTDTGNGRNYCVAIEIQDANNNGQVDHGWGTFIVYNAATREINHTAPHAVSDISTETQAVSLFKNTNSRSFMMSGASRDLGTSNCQGDSGYAASDAAHNIDHLFFAGTEALSSWYGSTSWWQIQWHGMAVDTCTTNAYISHGFATAPPPDSKTVALKNNILKYHPTWSVTVPGGSPSCSLNATENVEGRFLNGVPRTSCCGTNATTYLYKFIHIEQDPNYRNPSDWLQAVLDTWP